MNTENFFETISAAFVPVMAAVILAYGLLRAAPVYDYFIEGAKKGLATAIEILPFRHLFGGQRSDRLRTDSIFVPPARAAPRLF
mgnify:CR=1 FL=1